jgi:hypothetical protein
MMMGPESVSVHDMLDTIDSNTGSDDAHERIGRPPERLKTLVPQSQVIGGIRFRPPWPFY